MLYILFHPHGSISVSLSSLAAPGHNAVLMSCGHAPPPTTHPPLLLSEMMGIVCVFLMQTDWQNGTQLHKPYFLACSSGCLHATIVYVLFVCVDTFKTALNINSR